MAARKKQRLKVYRTRIGLSDWVVAVPNQKAALAAWDVHENLFARGAASIEDDPARIKMALRAPGTPVAVSTKRDVDQALAQEAKRAASRPKIAPKKKTAPRKEPKPQPPDRSALDKAENALTQFRRRVIRERSDLLRRQRELDESMEKLEREHSEEEKRLKEALEAARARYLAAL